MNKTYSVIWSEVRHAYIVVSEYARKGYAKAAMAALAAAVVVSTGMPAALAAAPPAVNAATVSGTDNVVTLRDGTTASDVNQAFELVYTHSDQIEANANDIATNKSDIAANKAAMEQADAALHTEILEEADARQAADEKEAATRAAADTALNGAVNGGLSLDDNGVLQRLPPA